LAGNYEIEKRTLILMMANPLDPGIVVGRSTTSFESEEDLESYGEWRTEFDR
jgi:hypothetical protein